ncbi:hypothetical protein [Anaplasma phagocytophilum]|nr:hypothetical protein [Anaplasma phagocytophilum]
MVYSAPSLKKAHFMKKPFKIAYLSHRSTGVIRSPDHGERVSSAENIHGYVLENGVKQHAQDQNGIRGYSGLAQKSYSAPKEHESVGSDDNGKKLNDNSSLSQRGVEGQTRRSEPDISHRESSTDTVMGASQEPIISDSGNRSAQLRTASYLDAPSGDGEMRSPITQSVGLGYVDTRGCTNSSQDLEREEGWVEPEHDYDERDRFYAVEKNFYNTYQIKLQVLENVNRCMQINLHSEEPLSVSYVKKIKKLIKNTISVYEEEFGDLHPPKEQRKLDIYLFSHKNTLSAALETINEDKNAGGMAWPSLGKIYVAKQGKNKIENLPHEITHQLMYYTTGAEFNRAKASDFLREGVADYVQNIVMRGKGVTLELSSVISSVVNLYERDPALKNAKTLKEVASIVEGHAQDRDYASLKYSMGVAFVKYLQDTEKSLLKTYFRAANLGYIEEIPDELPRIISFISPKFHTWLHKNSLQKFMEKHDTLTVFGGEQLGFRDSIHNGKVGRTEVYAAKLEGAHHKLIGELSATAHVSAYGNPTVLNPHTTDKIMIDKDYQNLKLINTVDGKRYVYSNSDGKEYFSSGNAVAVSHISKIFAKYDKNFTLLHTAIQNLQEKLRGYIFNTTRETQGEFVKAVERVLVFLTHKDELARYSDGVIKELEKISMRISDPRDAREVASKIQEVYSSYVTAKTQHLLAQSSTGSSNEAMLSRILKTLIYIDPDMIIATDAAGFAKIAEHHSREILEIRGTGQGDYSGLSIYMRGHKIGELPTNTEEFTISTDELGKTTSTFYVNDVLKAVHTAYGSAPVIIVTEDAYGNKVANFFASTRSGTVHSSEVEVAVNQFISMASSGVKARASYPLTKGIGIAHYVPENKDSDQAVVQRSVKVNNRGTDREDDDRYAANVTIGNKLLIEKMSSLQFHITEGRKDAAGNYIDRSELIIVDMLADRVLQFPESITHLKLVKTSGGTIRLVPCTSTGEVDPEGMPKNMEGYSYIDPIHVYDRVESKWVNSNTPFNMVNLSRYPSGTLFEMRYDPNDPSIPKDEYGNVVRVNDQSYRSRVGIFTPTGEKIGELASAASFFQGKVFISLDTSYSYSDFVSSMYQQDVDVTTVGESKDGIKRVSLSGEADLGTDRGFSDYFSFNQRTRQDTQEFTEEMYRHTTRNARNGGDNSSNKPGDLPVDTTRPEDVTVVRTLSTAELALLNSKFLYMNQVGFRITDVETGHHVSFPKAITHVKVVTYNGQKHLVPSTADGDISPKGISDDGKVEQVYINPILVHHGISLRAFNDEVLATLEVMDLNAYKDGYMFELRPRGSLSYTSTLTYGDRYPNASEPDKPARLTTHAHLYDGSGKEVGILSAYTASGRSVGIVAHKAQERRSFVDDDAPVKDDNSGLLDVGTTVQYKDTDNEAQAHRANDEGENDMGAPSVRSEAYVYDRKTGGDQEFSSDTVIDSSVNAYPAKNADGFLEV